jgi:hypothetical protein
LYFEARVDMLSGTDLTRDVRTANPLPNEIHLEGSTGLA